MSTDRQRLQNINQFHFKQNKQSQIQSRLMLYTHKENLFSAIMLVIVLLFSGGCSSHRQLQPQPSENGTEKLYDFEPDNQVLGKWLTVDFVRNIEDFNPVKKNWSGTFYMLSLNFHSNGKLESQSEKNAVIQNWTKGVLRPLAHRPSFYYLRNINGQLYLFMEWISGDVTIRGEEPWYYVLKKSG